MAKEFSARVSKRERKVTDITAGIDEKILRANDQKLLRGAQLSTIALNQIVVREQVRTKFNDESLRELGENIKVNGLIQPLVIHREVNKFVLICGERRFRAMTLIDMKEAPCFILENKTKEELMAIQFSENQAREDLHYIDQADSIYGYQKLTGTSERKITAALGISKSEVHRCLMIAKLPKDIKEAAKAHNIEKYVLLEWDELPKNEFKTEIKERILSGEITKRLQLKRIIAQFQIEKPRKKKDDSVEKLMKVLKSQMKDPSMQAKAKLMMEELMS
ncbi:ParB/RepB/Spo0J family partition protein [Peredibacter starrii]|uniref:ParB/RepB/Spo0J family partition protein n=1 Tax=Peredibacter starrii TaxID=28202 RepID=A0AAX4HP85_9BACT|nr:ParB/RepB/Spo0J family partition protein [Peredibacter starrii]WPU65015.1 ParB/RepB/Spo0J family partition protein [Peredibacter starrii]